MNLETFFEKSNNDPRSKISGIGASLIGASQVARVVKNLPANAGDIKVQVQSPGQEDFLKEGMATHSSILVWRIQWTEEPGGLQSMGSELDTTEATQHACTDCVLTLHARLEEK